MRFSIISKANHALLILLMLFSIFSRINAGEERRSPLASIKNVNPTILLTWGDGISAFQEDDIKQRLQSRLEYEVRRAELGISDTSLSHLVVEFTVLPSEDSKVIYSYAISIYELAISMRELDFLWRVSDDMAKFTSKSRIEKQSDLDEGDYDRLYNGMAWYNATKLVSNYDYHMSIMWQGTFGIGTVKESHISNQLDDLTTQLAIDFLNQYLSVNNDN
jgi:hypothetical protein